MVDLRLPTAIDDERFVLGSILNDETAMHDMRPLVEAQDFALDRHSVVWQACCGLYDAGQPVDYVQVFHALTEAGRATAGGLSGLVSLIDGIPANSHLGAYVGRLKEKAALRRLIWGLDAILKRASLGEPSQELIEAAAAVASGTNPKTMARGLQSMEEIVEEVGISKLLSSRRERGLMTPWSWMNWRTNGFLPAELWVLAAPTSCGKTSAALQLAIGMAQRGIGTSFFSLEVGKGDLFLKSVIQLARVDSERVNSGEPLEPWEREAMRNAANELRSMPLYLDTTATTTAAIHAAVRQRSARDKIGFVVVDYLQLLGDSGRTNNRAQAVGANAWALKMLATDFQIPVLLLSQLSRDSTKPGKQRRPELSDLKESGDIENHANGVWFIYRQSQEDADMVDVEFILAKQRSGRRNVSKSLYFLPRYQRFEEKTE